MIKRKSFSLGNKKRSGLGEVWEWELINNSARALFCTENIGPTKKKKTLRGMATQDFDGTWRAILGSGSEDWKAIEIGLSLDQATKAVEKAAEAPGATPPPESPYFRRNDGQLKLPGE